MMRDKAGDVIAIEVGIERLIMSGRQKYEFVTRGAFFFCLFLCFCCYSDLYLIQYLI